MALTANDVASKQFSRPKGFGRSGYDEGQVDDFLDEVVVELRRLTAQNDDLTDKLEDCRQGKSPAVGGTSAKATAPAPAASAPVASGAAGVPALTPVNKSAQSSSDTSAKDEEIAKLKAERDAAERDLKAAQQRVQELEKKVAEEKSAPAAQAASLQEHAGATDAASVIALAQQVHDQHVKEGEAERDRLVSEAKAHHEKVITEANTKSEELLSSAKKRNEELVSSGQKRHDELVASGQKQHDELVSKGQTQSTKLVTDAEDRRQKIMTELEARRTSLNAEIEKLKKFESDYRSNLKGYITEQLRQLDQKSSAPVAGQGPKNA